MCNSTRWCRWFGVLACLAGFGLISAATSGSSRDEKAEKKTANNPAERVKLSKKLLKDADTYPKGCSEFVSKVLGIPWESANALMGDKPMYVGVDGKYTGLKPGDIVGWKKESGHGHVAVYIGENETRFIDVHQDGEKPRSLSS